MTGDRPYRISLDQVAAGIDRVRALPASVIEVLRCLDANVPNHELSAALALDQALVARLLRIVNSPFYGLSRRIASISEAIIVLGYGGVRMLATAAALASRFASGSMGGIDLPAFWRHSVAVALISRELAKRAKVNPETAFAVGLLHDIGRLVLANAFPVHMRAVVAYRQEIDCSMIDAEQSLLGIDHAQVGGLLAQHWFFPQAMCDAIALHHAPPVAAPLDCIAHVADAIAHGLDLAGDPDEVVPVINPACWQAFRPAADEAHNLFADVVADFSQACELFAP